MLIKDANLSIKAKRLINIALDQNEPATVQDLQKLAGVNLVKFRGFGNVTADEVRQFMIDNNILTE